LASPHRESFDVAVVGGGIIGLSVAWQVARRGARVVVLERGPLAGEASHVAAGMLAPVSEAEFGEDELLSLNLAGARRWPEWAAELQEASGRDPGLRRCGTLMIARDADEAEALERLLEFRRGLGLEVERLRPSAARHLEPALAPTVRLALHVPEDHAADPRLTCAALVEAARRAGAVLRTQAPVESVGAGGVALADGTSVDAPQVVLAAGSWSGELLPGLPVRPVKGQILHLRDPSGPGLVDRVVRMAEGYLVPRGDGRYALGATVEERGFDTTITAVAVHDLLRDAAEAIPGVLELQIEEIVAGLRPGTPDNAPILGVHDGVVVATGHWRNGVLLAPLTGELVAGLLAGEGVPDFAAPFAPARFAAPEVLA
jgi:glycine oxidase